MEPSTRYQILGFVMLMFQTSNYVVGERFVIVHWNDVGGQLQRFSPGTGQTSLPPVTCETENCVGGLSNLVHYINESATIDGLPATNVFKLTSGNLASGENGWLSVVGWDNYGSLLKDFYKPTAMSLGIKDFGAGIDRTNTYLTNASVPNVVLTNVDCTNSVEATFCKNIVKMLPLTATIGLLGFTNPNVMLLGSPGSLKFEDIVLSLSNEVNKNPQIKTFVAIGDGSLDTSKRILEAVPKIKLVIYGMGFGNSKDMSARYPEPFLNGYIATAGRYGSTIGKLLVDIDANTGDLSVISASSKLISTVGRQLVEDAASKKVNEFAADVIKYDEPIGHTIFKLEGGERCWRNECNLGNLVTDAMVHCALINSTMALIDQTPVLSLWHGGALFDDKVPPSQPISHLDIHKWLPYHNRAHLVKIQGARLWEVFQTSAKGITADVTDGTFDWGQFLQVSNGLEIYYNTKGNEPVLEKIRILHEDDSTPVMKDIDMNLQYYFVIPSIIVEGRTVYGFAKNYWTKISNIGFDDECLLGYIKALQKVSIGFEERIWINADLPCDAVSKSNGGTSTTVTVIVTIVIMTVLIAIAYVGIVYVYPKLTGRMPNSNSNGNEFSNFRSV